MYEIRSSRQDEAELLETFIEQKWKERHSLSQNRALPDRQHLDSKTGNYDFIIARQPRTSSIDGVLGFLPTWHFDGALPGEGDFDQNGPNQLQPTRCRNER